MEALGYYDYNAILITLSFAFLTLSIKNLKGYKAATFINILFFLFIPSYFLDFVIYGDVFCLFFISIGLFLLSLNNLKEEYKILVISLFVGFAYMARSNSVVWLIALLIAYLVYKKLTWKNLLLSLLSIIIFLFPSTINRIIIEKTYNVDLSENSMPTINWIFIGTGYSNDGDAGIYNPLGMDTLGATGYNKNETSKALKEGLSKNLDNLSNVKELALFLKRKIQNTWTDPDFETMGFVMPNNGYDVELFVNEGYRLPVGTSVKDASYTNKLGEFVYDNFEMIRNVEKVFVFEIFIILLISAYLRIKNNRFSFTSLFLELNTVGFFLLQIFLETKPRYVLISFIIAIVLASYEMPLLEEQLKRYNLFSNKHAND